MLQDRLVAHRGFQKYYPENTLVAYQAAIEAGAHYIETDILFSADGEPVLYHDMTMDRVSGIESALHVLPLSELERLPAYEPQRLGNKFKDNKITPLSNLVSLLQQHPQVTAFIEAKRTGIELVGIEKAYQRIISELAPVLPQCVLISFNDKFIEYARQQNFPCVGLVLKNWEELNQGFIADIEPEYIFIDTKKVPAGSLLYDIASTTVIYEVEDPQEASQWFEQGADMIETFDIGGMISELARRII